MKFQDMSDEEKLFFSLPLGEEKAKLGKDSSYREW